MYVLVIRQNNKNFVIGCRKDLKETLYLFAKEDQDPTKHQEVMKHVPTTLNNGNHRNIKIESAAVVAKYFSAEHDAFHFSGAWLVEDKEQTFDYSKNGKFLFIFHVFDVH
jgi:hypothetical protein